MTRSITCAALLAAACTSCSDAPSATSHALVTTHIPSPAPAPSSLPNLTTSADGRLYLTWVTETSTQNGTSTASLHFARSNATTWTPPREIARGEHWFVNWADFPALAALDERRLIASFLEQTGASTYDYAAQIVLSSDGGATWTAPVTLHSDTHPGEHGFVSLAALAEQRFAAVWLDSRNMKAGEHGSHQGAMSLFLRTVDPADQGGALGPEILIDDRVCDCCQTALVETADGALVVAYRDRSADEVRDISLVRVERDGTMKTVFTSADGWKIAGCPVNGPALDVSGQRVGLAWFTLGRDGLARVLCAFSEDGGKHFSDPFTIAQGIAQGRVDAMFDADGALIVTWLEADEQRARWLAARVEQAGRTSKIVGSGTIAETASSRSSGFGRLGRDGDDFLFAFTAPGTPTWVELVKISWH